MALTVEPQYLAISQRVSSGFLERMMTLGRSGSGSRRSPARIPVTMEMGSVQTLESRSSMRCCRSVPLPSRRSSAPPRSQVQGTVSQAVFRLSFLAQRRSRPWMEPSGSSVRVWKAPPQRTWASPGCFVTVGRSGKKMASRGT